jgi:5-methylcytosine-specific restriction endonuclease McrA
MAKKKQAVNLSAMCRFTKSVLGHSGRMGVSIYDLTSKALEKQGYFKDGLNSKQHVVKYSTVVLAEVKKLGLKPQKIAHSESPAKSAYSGPNVTTDAFLESYEWRRLRMEAIKKYGARCQCCGATPADGIKINVDHIKPRKLFPHLALSLDNLQCLCGPCNHGKGNWDMTDWRNREPEDAFLLALDKIKSSA